MRNQARLNRLYDAIAEEYHKHTPDYNAIAIMPQEIESLINEGGQL